MNKNLFIDIHNHIIHEFDDGPQSFDTVKAMLEKALEQSTGTIFATSHFQEYANKELTDEYYKKLNLIKDYIKNNSLPIEIKPGAEVFQHPGIEKSAFTYPNYRLNENSRYLLFEYPLFQMPNSYTDTIFKLRLSKLRPIIAHPERYNFTQKNIAKIVKMVSMGALMQVNGGSILGYFGSNIQKLSLELLKYRLVHFIASDAHGTGNRTFLLQDTYNYLKKKISESYLHEIFFINPEKILNNEDLEPPVPDLDNNVPSLKNKIFHFLKFK